MDRLHSQDFSAELIDLLCTQHRQLLEQNWIEMWSCRPDGPDAGIRGSVTFSIEPFGREYTLNSSFSYGIRYKHRASGKCNYDDQSTNARAA